MLTVAHPPVASYPLWFSLSFGPATLLSPSHFCYIAHQSVDIPFRDEQYCTPVYCSHRRSSTERRVQSPQAIQHCSEFRFCSTSKHPSRISQQLAGWLACQESTQVSFAILGPIQLLSLLVTIPSLLEACPLVREHLLMSYFFVNLTVLSFAWLL